MRDKMTLSDYDSAGHCLNSWIADYADRAPQENRRSTTEARWISTRCAANQGLPRYGVPRPHFQLRDSARRSATGKKKKKPAITGGGDRSAPAGWRRRAPPFQTALSRVRCVDAIVLISFSGDIGEQPARHF